MSIVGAGTRLVQYSDHGATLKVGGGGGGLASGSKWGGGMKTPFSPFSQ